MTVFSTDYRRVTNIHDCNILQEELLSQTEWDKTWQMQFNVKTCYVMPIIHKKVPLLFGYTMNNSTLELVKNYPYLGVSLTDNLSWSDHVNKGMQGKLHHWYSSA